MPRVPRSSPTQATGSLVNVVEDDPANRALMTWFLERDGYRVIAVADDEAGYRAVAEHAPDFVLLDVGLPKLDGYEVTRWLRQDPSGADAGRWLRRPVSIGPRWIEILIGPGGAFARIDRCHRDGPIAISRFAGSWALTFEPSRRPGDDASARRGVG